MSGMTSAGADATFVVVGIDQYDDWPELPGVRRDVGLMAKLLQDLGFERREVHLDTTSSVQALRNALEQWRRERAAKSVIYWAGHAGVNGSFYFLVKTSPGDSLEWTPATALGAHDLAPFIVASEIKEILLVLDVCYAGGASTTVLKMLWEILDQRTQSNQHVWMLASARAQEPAADENAFVQKVDRLLRRGRADKDHLWTQYDPFVTVDNLARALEGELAFQHPELKGGGNPLSVNFFPNLGYSPGWPSQTVADAAKRWAALDRDEADSHFWPRSRGNIDVEEAGWYFVGRTQVLRELVTWLETGSGLRVVTGSPGAGKSAILGRLATLADPAYRAVAEKEHVLEDAPLGTVPKVGSITVAMRLTGKTAEDCLRRIAEVCEIELPSDTRPSSADVVAALDRRALGSATLLLDGLDEATEPSRIAELIRQLAVTQRVLVGTRQNLGRGPGQDPTDPGPLLKALGARPEQITDLGDDQEAKSGIVDYARKRLADSRTDCPYQWDPDLATAAARSIGLAAGGVFRLAHDWCRLLCAAPDALTPTSLAFQSLLREGSAGVFRAELARFGPQEPKARELLTALAWSQGLGLPRRVWPVVATALSGLASGSGTAYDPRDVVWGLERAGHLILEAGEHGQTVYRPYHQEFADYLREQLTHLSEAQVQRAIAEALAAAARARGWEDLDPYVAYHLPAHAAAGALLEELVMDAGFLTASDPPRLLRVLGQVESETGRGYARLYVQAIQRLRGRPPAQRALVLDLVAHQHGWGDRLFVPWESVAWKTRWAHWRPSEELIALDGHSGGVNGVALGEVEGRPVVATASGDATARLWDARSGEPLHTMDARALVNGVTVGNIDGQSVVVAAGADGTVRFWDSRSGQPVRTIDLHGGPVRCLALGESDGRPVLVAASDDATARLWDARSGELLRSFQGHTDWVTSVALSHIDGRPIVATASVDRTVRLWSPRNGELLHVLDGHSDAVRCVVVGEIDAGAVIATASDDQTARLWDARNGKPLRTLEGHGSRVWSVALGHVDGRPVVATASDDRTARLWDARNGGLLRTLEGHENAVWGVALGDVDGRPVVATASADWTARLWDARSKEHSLIEDRNNRSFQDVVMTDIDGRPVVVTSSSDGAQLWDADSGELIRTLGDAADTFHYDVGIAPGKVNGRPLIVTTSDEGVEVWDMRSGEPLCTLTREDGGRFRSVGLTDIDGRPVVVTSSSDGAQLWDADSGELIRTLGDAADTFHYDVGIAPGKVNGRPLIVTTSDEGVEVWDMRSGEPLCTLTREDGGRFRSVGLTDIDGRPVVVTWSFDSVQLWDAVSGELVRTLVYPDALEHAEHTQFYRVELHEVDDRPIVVTIGFHRMQVWDAGTGDLIRTLTGTYPDPVRNGSLGEVDGRTMFANMSIEGTVHLWDARRYEELTELTIPPLGGRTVAVALGKNQLAIAGDRGILVLEGRGKYPRQSQ